MAVDLRQLGKLLALTRSQEPEEALRAEEVFTRLFFKWCDEQGLPENVGFARIGDAGDLSELFLHTVSEVVGTKVLVLNTFDLGAVGTLPACRWLSWWYDHVLPEIVRTSEKSAYAERDAFQAGACRGIRAELMSRMAEDGVVHVPLVALDRIEVVPAPAEREAASEAAPPPKAPPVPTPKQREALSAGQLFGRNLTRRSLSRCPLPTAV